MNKQEEQEKAANIAAIDLYDASMRDPNSVADALIEIVSGDNQQRKDIADLIIQIEGHKGKDIQGKMALITLIMDGVTDELFRQAESIIEEKGAN